MIHSIALVSTGTVVSRLLGFVRDAMVAALLGAGAAADAFLFAFQLITLTRRLFSEGALNAAMIPAWWSVREQGGARAAAAFAGRAVASLGLIVASAALLIGLAAPWLALWLVPGLTARGALADAILELRLMLPYLAFAGPAAVMLAIANAQRRVTLSALAPALFNLMLIAVAGILLTSDRSAREAAIVLAAAVGAAGLFQLALLFGAGRAAARPLRIGVDREMRTLLARSVNAVVSSGGFQWLLIIGAVMVAQYPSAISWLYFAGRLIDLPLGIVGTVAGTVMLAETTDAVQAHRQAAVRRAHAQSVGLALALALPASIGLGLLAEPIVRAIFARGAFADVDAAETARALRMLSLALPAHALAKVLAARLFAHADTRTPLIATLVGAGATLLLSLIVPQGGGAASVALAISGGSWIMAALLAVKAGMPWSHARLGRVCAAALTMALALAGLLRLFASAAGSIVGLHLMMLISAAIAIYGASLIALRAVHPRELSGAWRALRGHDAHGNQPPP